MNIIKLLRITGLVAIFNILYSIIMFTISIKFEYLYSIIFTITGTLPIYVGDEWKLPQGAFGDLSGSL